MQPDDLVDSKVSPDSDIDDRTTAERTRAALAQIPPHFSQVVELKLKGYDNFEIAAELDIDYDTVRSRYSRGKAQLLALLRKHKA